MVDTAASLAANVVVAQPSVAGRVIAAWPSFALIGAYELLTRQIRRSAAGTSKPRSRPGLNDAATRRTPRRPGPGGSRPVPAPAAAGWDLQQQAWQWALAYQADHGSLPRGRQIADQYGRPERWGRLVKRAGAAGEFSEQPEPALHLLIHQATPAARE